MCVCFTLGYEEDFEADDEGPMDDGLDEVNETSRSLSREEEERRKDEDENDNLNRNSQGGVYLMKFNSII